MNPNSGHNFLHAEPINAVNGSNEASWWHSHHILYVVSLIKINIFHIFHPKMWKIALHPIATYTSYNSGTFDDTCTLFAPNWGFLGLANRMVSFKFYPELTLVAMVTNHHFSGHGVVWELTKQNF